MPLPWLWRYVLPCWDGIHNSKDKITNQISVPEYFLMPAGPLDRELSEFLSCKCPHPVSESLSALSEEDGRSSRSVPLEKMGSLYPVQKHNLCKTASLFRELHSPISLSGRHPWDIDNIGIYRKGCTRSVSPFLPLLHFFCRSLGWTQLNAWLMSDICVKVWTLKNSPRMDQNHLWQKRKTENNEKRMLKPLRQEKKSQKDWLNENE